MHIAFYDSGLGGLSVAKSYLNNLIAHSSNRCRPLQKITYLADTGAYPYGDKPADWLKTRACSVVAELLSAQTAAPPDIIVVACNTASTLVLDELRARFVLPFVGVVPAIKPAARFSYSKSLAVLATEATVARDYTAQLINDYAPDCEVSLYACENLVHQAEQKLLNGKVEHNVIADAVKPLLHNSTIDTAVLACTHFPILREELATAAPAIRWIDSGQAIASRIDTLANALDISHLQENHKPRMVLATTGGSKEGDYRDNMPALLAYLGLEASEASLLNLALVS